MTTLPSLPSHSILPQHNWWLWNILEVCVRIVVILIVAFTALLSVLLTDIEHPATDESFAFLLLCNLGLAIAAIFRFKKLARFCISVIASFVAFSCIYNICPISIRDVVFIIVLHVTILVLLEYRIGLVCFGSYPISYNHQIEERLICILALQLLVLHKTMILME
jgi:hypothetical protein